MTTDMRPTILAEHEGYELVRYPSGETRIEHPASRTCSVWMTAAEIAEVETEPSRMAAWASEEDMEPMGSPYTITVRDDAVDESRPHDGPLALAATEAAAWCASWIRDGDWGEEGALVEARWTVTDATGAVLAEGEVEVAIDPDHGALIERAVGAQDDTALCGYGPDDHDWTHEDEGGCDDNPGVWSLGGTTYMSRAHCRDCGLSRREVTHGSQRNPGEADTVEYEYDPGAPWLPGAAVEEEEYDRDAESADA